MPKPPRTTVFFEPKGDQANPSRGAGRNFALFTASADEPTTGFDPAARRTAWQTIRSLKDLGKTVLLTTHYLDEAQELADRVAIIKGGQILAEGSPAELGVGGKSRYRVAYVVGGEPVVHQTDDPTSLLHELTAAALARGERIEGLSVTRPSLEEVYLELTADG